MFPQLMITWFSHLLQSLELPNVRGKLADTLTVTRLLLQPIAQNLAQQSTQSLHIPSEIFPKDVEAAMAFEPNRAMYR